jgi:hypothetical protein
MPAHEDPAREAHSSPSSTVEFSFDSLARGLASGTISRRQALRWMGGALVGSALASIPGVALARPSGNMACDEFCHAVFTGRAAGQCTQSGTRGAGPCFKCTPGVGPGPNFTPPECGAGERFNPSTCQCELICSNACCCSCDYIDPVTGERTVVCNSPTTATTPIECNEICAANVPPGLTLNSSGFGCNSDLSGSGQFVCAPISEPGITGLACFTAPC